MKASIRCCLLAILVITALSRTGMAAELPTVGFIENKGQLPPEVLFYAPGPEVSVYLTKNTIVIDQTEHVRPTILGADGRSQSPNRKPNRNKSVRGCATFAEIRDAVEARSVDGVGQRPQEYNFFNGADASTWHVGARVYSSIIYRDIRPGLDLQLTLDEGQLHYQARPTVAGAAEWRGFAYAGANETVVKEGTQIELETPGAVILDSMTQSGGGTGTIEIKPSSAPAQIVADNPSLLRWSALFGPNSDIYNLALDSSGNVVMVGSTDSPTFPTTPGAYDRTGNGITDGFVAKLSSTGSTLLWGTYIGGMDYDDCVSLRLDTADNVFIIGEANSPDFPTTQGAYDRTLGGANDAYVAKLSSSGSTLLWSTYLGGGGADIEWVGRTLAFRRPSRELGGTALYGTSSSGTPWPREWWRWLPGQRSDFSADCQVVNDVL